jgi:hypothetical protein
VERNSRQQAWYVARHLKMLSGHLAKLGFFEASLLVGAAAISVGDAVVSSANPPLSASPLRGTLAPTQDAALHG